MLYLIRHGKTTANEKRLYCGATDVPLSEAGVRLIEENKRNGVYRQLPSNAVYITSGLSRARQTLEIIANGAKIHVIRQLNEINFGDFEMKCYDELREIPDYISWISDFENTSIPNGESYKAFKRRVEEGVCEARALCLQNGVPHAVIATHGGVIAALTKEPSTDNHVNGKPLSFHERIPDFGGVRVLV